MESTSGKCLCVRHLMNQVCFLYELTAREFPFKHTYHTKPRQTKNKKNNNKYLVVHCKGKIQINQCISSYMFYHNNDFVRQSPSAITT